MIRRGTVPRRAAIFAALLVLLSGMSLGAQEVRPLILHEMTWPEVKEYLARSDMVIIPLGSTEQQGPHLPLGTDMYEAAGIVRRISSRTGVVVAELTPLGYSEYHMGFPGTVSVRPETLERYLIEAVESLITHGFRRIMFYNYHGGNSLIQQRVIYHINTQTGATAVAIGIGSSVRRDSPAKGQSRFFDWHAGFGETSLMLFLEPDRVRREKIENPVIRFSGDTAKLNDMLKSNPELEAVWAARVGVLPHTGKGGASHEFSSNGVWSLNDLRKATAEYGKERTDAMVDAAVSFIEAWRRADR